MGCNRDRLRLRLAAGLAFLAFFLLVDEIVKEGYVFSIEDLISLQITHEKLFLALLALSLFFGLKKSSPSQETQLRSR